MALGRGSLAVVVALATAGVALADPQVDRAVTALRSDPSAKVRAQAAFVLARRNAREAVPDLAHALAVDGAAPVRVAAVAALGRIGGAAAIPPLQHAAAADADARVREAAATALERVVRGARSVALEDVAGGADGGARRVLRDALASELERHGFAVVDRGADAAGWRLKPSVLHLAVDQSGPGMRVEVRASVIAVDGQGRMAAMIEGGARARTATAGAPVAQVTAQAFQATARSLSEDLAARLLDVR